MTDVTVSVEPANDGLLTGMRKFSGNIDSAIVKRVGERPNSGLRDIMRIDPIGNKRDSLDGIVHDIVQLRLDEKFGIDSGILGGQEISKLFPNLKATQITVLVDEIATDPDAVDFLSYTVWCKPTKTIESLSKGHIVSLTVTPKEIWGIGRKWLGNHVDRIL